MNNETSVIGSENNQASITERLVAENRAKTEALLAPYRTKRDELRAKREEIANALDGVDRDLAELDEVIAQVEASAGLQPAASARRKKKPTRATAAAAKPAVEPEWLIQKLREQPRTQADLSDLAKAEGFKPSSVRGVAARLLETNAIRVNGAAQYEVA
jgi:hypothetical protein